ncbi:hypothetical protein, partial [Candidatus Phycosocius spiralis]|uniref:hypothetical protein n=1 Tax=Candidatus Phycosocius spiralis TaxID=2815099 RepID=UPI0024E0D71F
MRVSSKPSTEMRSSFSATALLSLLEPNGHKLTPRFCDDAQAPKSKTALNPTKPKDVSQGVEFDYVLRTPLDGLTLTGGASYSMT